MSQGRFFARDEVERDALEGSSWAGTAGRRPLRPGNWWSIEVKLEPGGGHDFHRHPNQKR